MRSTVIAEAFTYESVGDLGLGVRQILDLTSEPYHNGHLYSILQRHMREENITVSAPSETSRIEKLLKSRKRPARMLLELLAVEENCTVDDLLSRAQTSERVRQEQKRGISSNVAVFYRGVKLGGRLLRSV